MIKKLFAAVCLLAAPCCAQNLVHTMATALKCADSSGSGTAQSCNTDPIFTPVARDWIIYTTTTANTGDVTVNVNSLGAKHIKKWLGSVTLASGDLPANIPVPLYYDGTAWEIGSIGNAPSGGGGISTITGPSSLLGWGVSGGTATATLQDQTADTLFGGQPSSTQVPQFVQGLSTSCASGSSTSLSCSFTGSVASGNLIFATFQESNAGTPVITDNVGDTFTCNNYLSFIGRIAGVCYTISNGGSVTLTVSGFSTAEVAMAAGEFTGVTGTVDVSANGSTTNPMPSITTTNANDLILGASTEECGGLSSYTAGPGFSLASYAVAITHTGAALQWTAVASIGTYAPSIFPNCGAGINMDATFAFEAASVSSAKPSFMFLSFGKFSDAFPGLLDQIPSQTSGDTGLDLHIGNAINAEATTSAYAGNNSASTLYALPTLPLSGEALHCWVYVSCHSTTSTATVIPALLWTDESNTAETNREDRDMHNAGLGKLLSILATDPCEERNHCLPQNHAC